MIKYYMPKAKNLTTRMTVMHRNMGNTKFTHSERKLCQDVADQYAAKLSTRTGDTWLGYVEEYTPGTVTA